MIHVAVHLLGLAFLGAAAWLAGRLAVELLPGDPGPFRNLACFCLGLAYWIHGLFLLAAAGHLNAGGLALLALPVAVLAAAFGRRWTAPLPSTRSRIIPSELVFALGLGAVLLLTFLLTVSPRVSWDADVYHLTLPRLYLEHGGFRPVPMSVYSNWPLSTELLYAAAMMVGDYMLAKAVHFGFGLLLVFAVYTAAWKDGSSAERGRLAAWLAAALLLANEVVGVELRQAYVDLAHAFYFTSAFVFLHRALEDDERHGTDRRDTALLLSGICCGLAAGVKVTGIVAAGVIGALYLPRLARKARRQGLGRALAPFLARFALPVALLWAPWLVKTAAYTGNPFYPFLYGAFGGPDWSEALGERLREWQSGIGMGREPLDYLLLPFRVALSGGDGYARFDGEIQPFWLVLVPLAAVFGRRSALAGRALAGAGLYFVFWAASSQQMRFLIPALPLAAIAGAEGFLGLFDRLPPIRWRRALVLVLAGLLVATVYGPWLSGGVRNLAAFERVEADLASTVVPEHHRFVNERLPPEARLLFVNTNGGFFCRREYLADSFFEASQVADWLGDAATAEEVRRRLDDRGVTHVLVDRRPRVPNLPAALFGLLADPARARVVFRSSDDRFVVVELLAGP